MNAVGTVAYIEAALSILIFILSLLTGLLYGIEFFFGANRKDMQTLSAYFKYNTILTILVNMLCSLFVMIYFLWIVIDPLSSNELYFLHKSHVIRIVITVLWYISTMFPFFIYNGRLKFAFKSGKYGTSKTLFITLNVIIIILTPLSLIIGYLGVFIYNNPYLEWLGFNAFRIIYIILLLLLSWLFNKRMFIIIHSQTKLAQLSLVNTSSDHKHGQKLVPVKTDDIDTDNDDDDDDDGAINDDERILEILEYLNVVVKSSLLLTFMIISKIFVMSIWFLHNYQYERGHLSLTVGFLIMSFDSFIDEICVVLLYKYTQSYYAFICGCTTEQKLNNNTYGAHSRYRKFCTLFASCYWNKCYPED